MTSFDQREEAYERLHALGEERRFKTLARRTKLMGLWAADKLALSGAGATDYANRLVEKHFSETDPERLAEDLQATLSSVSPQISAHRIRRKIEEMTARATEEVAEGR